MRIMEAYLNELEARAQSSRKNFMESTLRRIDSSITREILSESIAFALTQARETRLIHYEDLPMPWRGNQFILSGYRFCETPAACCRSVFAPSNETVNIWSHVIGLVIVLAIAFYFYPHTSAYPLSTNWDVLIAATFFAAACKCLICSTMRHTMNSIASPHLLSQFACVDYSGIAFLIAASILTTEWTAFYCEPLSRSVYMSLTIVLGLLGSILPWRESFNRHDMAWFRVAFYVTLAGTGFAPVIQLNYTRGYEWTFYFYAPLVKSVMVYFVGAVIYASQVPEKWCPGMFDYFGGSHNIWHVAVLVAIVFHYTAMMEFFQGAFQRALNEENCCVR